MSFVHDDPEWPNLLAVVAGGKGLPVAMVEKDYWVTHALWAIHEQGFDVWFKGGTSLSKGFGLIERFSEDIDVRIDAGRVPGLVDPRLSWSNDKRGPSERAQWFDQLAATLAVPACTIVRNPAGSDARVRSAWLEVLYPRSSADYPALRPFVLLEVGRARVVPYVERALSSWVHEHLDTVGETGFTRNRPERVRCIHPWVTCLEKIDAIARRFSQGRAAADFVRHYEDAARVMERAHELPPLELDLPGLLAALAAEDHVQVRPSGVQPGPRSEVGRGSTRLGGHRSDVLGSSDAARRCLRRHPRLPRRDRRGQRFPRVVGCRELLRRRGVVVVPNALGNPD